jgi:hypothetical protein
MTQSENEVKSTSPSLPCIHRTLRHALRAFSEAAVQVVFGRSKRCPATECWAETSDIPRRSAHSLPLAAKTLRNKSGASELSPRHRIKLIKAVARHALIDAPISTLLEVAGSSEKFEGPPRCAEFLALYHLYLPTHPSKTSIKMAVSTAPRLKRHS